MDIWEDEEESEIRIVAGVFVSLLVGIILRSELGSKCRIFEMGLCNCEWCYAIGNCNIWNTRILLFKLCFFFDKTIVRRLWTSQINISMEWKFKRKVKLTKNFLSFVDFQLMDLNDDPAVRIIFKNCKWRCKPRINSNALLFESKLFVLEKLD